MTTNPFVKNLPEIVRDEERENEYVEEPDNDQILDPAFLLTGNWPSGFFGQIVDCGLLAAIEKTEAMTYDPKMRYELPIAVMTQPDNFEDEQWETFKSNAKSRTSTGYPLIWAKISRSPQQRNSTQGEWKERLVNYDPSIRDILTDASTFADMTSGRCFWFEQVNVTIGTFTLDDLLVPAGSIRHWDDWKEFRNSVGLPDIPAATEEETANMGPPAIRQKVDDDGKVIEEAKGKSNGAAKVEVNPAQALEEWTAIHLNKDTFDMDLFDEEAETLGIDDADVGREALRVGFRQNWTNETPDNERATKLFSQVEVKITTKSGRTKAKAVLGDLWDDAEEIVEGIKA